MRILLAGWECPPLFVYGGLGVFGHNLAEALAKMGHEVFWAGCTPPGAEHRTEQTTYTSIAICTVHDLQERNIYQIYIDVTTRIQALIRTTDLVLVNDLHMAPLIYMAKAYGVPVKYYVHALGGNPWEAAALMTSDEVLANSNQTRNLVQHALEAFLANLEPRPQPPPVRVVYPALPGHRPDPDPKFVEKLRQEHPGTIVLSVGRNQEIKNQGVMVEAVRILARRGYRVWGFIVGPGWGDRVEGNIVYMDMVGWDTNVLPSLYEAADIFVLPGFWEGFGLVALEAAAHGKPVVLSRNAGVREVLGEAPVFDPASPEDLADKLEQLIGSPGEAEKLGSRLREKALARNWTDVALEILGG